MAAEPQFGSSAANEAALPLLSDTVDGAVDFQGRPSVRSSSGGWRSASFIIGVEVAERLAFYGILSNLISYLTGPLGQSTAVAAENVNAWSGTGSLSPLLGAFIADMFLGCYRTIVVASSVYIMGLGLLTFSAVLPSLCPSNGSSMPGTPSCSPSIPQVVLFFFSLYLIAFAKGGHKPCVQAFGADQFDGQSPEECKARSSFFNWWYFWLSAGPMIVLFFLNYIQDNLSWGLGFGIPCISMAVALVLFLLGTRTYRYKVKGDEKSPFLRISTVFILAFKNRKTTSNALDLEEEFRGTLPNEASMQFKYLNKALLSPDGSKADGKVCSLGEVEEAKSVLRLIPIWLTSLVYTIVFSQPSTFFTKQGVTMDRVISPSFNVPPASLQSFISLAVVLFIPIYDRILVPLMRAFTGQPSGITMLQRIGIGIFLSSASMVIAALVEQKRLEIAREHGLVDLPDATVPMSVWWLIPQYALFGISEVFTMVGLQEFFYDQVPTELRSMGLSLYLSLFGMGNFLSSFLVSVIEKATGGKGKYSWFASNLNRAHLHYFYWLLAGLSALELMVYLYFSKSYIYNRARTM